MALSYNIRIEETGLRIGCTDTKPYVPENFRGESYEQF